MINALIIIPEITKGMKSVGSKALLPIKKEKCVLDYQINAIRNIDKNIHITIATGFESEKIIDLIKTYNNVDYIYDHNYKMTNQAQSLKLYLQKHPNITNLLLISSGVIFKSCFITKAMLKEQSKVFILNKQKENFTLGCNKNPNVEYIFFDLPDLWSECLYLNHEALSWLQHFTESRNIEQMYIFELINELLSHKILMHKQVVNKKDIIKITHLKDINKAKTFI